MRSTAISFVVGLAVLAAACGSSSPASPTSSASAARPAPAPGTSTTTGATISGTVIGVSGASRLRTMSVGMTVSVAGTSTATSVDGSGHFVLQNVPSGNVTLQFTGTGVNATLTLSNVAPNSTLTISVQVSGTTAQLDTGETEGPDNDAEIEGTVTAKGTNTLTVAGKAVSVAASTTITHGDTKMALADIKVGDRVHVHGTLSGTTSTTITATTIEVQDGMDTPGDGGDKNPNIGGGDQGGTQTETEVSGTVSVRAGTCPALTFTVGSTKVSTSASTKFENTTCSTLANGDKVQVQGTKQTDGSVSASQVEKKSK